MKKQIHSTTTNPDKTSRGLKRLGWMIAAWILSVGFVQAQVTFNYTGGVQTYTVPAGVTSITVDMYGAEGFGALGYGGRLQATHPVTPGEVLQVYVGGAGTNTAGGFNGGGNPGTNSGYGGGGGASDIRRGGTTLSNRILVAGGGGGTGSNCGTNTAEGGHGGGLTGESGCLYSCSDCQYTGSGGTQSSGGIAGPTAHGSCGGNTNGSFGQGGSNTVGGYGTGGGGGWYGGGSGCFEGAGGGSSYSSPSASGVIHTVGARQGNGVITITPNGGGGGGCTTPSGLSATPSTICAGSSANLTATSTGNTIYWYTVSTGGTSIGNSASGANFGVTPSITTTYYAEAQGGSSSGSQTFNFTGGVQTFTVPAGVTSITVDMYGAEGFGALGYGGRLQATHPVTPGEVLQVYVGGAGSNTTGGFNGGGNPGTNTGYGGGGGASDIRRGGTTLSDRILVAGGGGGTGSNCGTNTAEGGHGGGLTAESGCLYSCSSCQYTGGGGTQSSGGIAGPTSHGSCGGNTNGSFGQGGSNTVNGYGTGGGGGWYGGGSGCFEGAGGGSSYSSPSATGVTHTIGARTGNGLVVITYSGSSCTPSTRVPVTVTVDQFTAANAGPDQTVCSTSATLAGNTATTGGGNWTLISGSGTVSTPTSPTSGVIGLGTGANTFRWTLANGVCTDSQDDVILTGDNVNPTISCPSNISVNNDAGVCGATVSYTAPVGTDNCPSPITSRTAGQASGTVFPIGTTTVTYQVVDGFSNSANCSFTVTVADNEAPTFSNCPANIAQAIDSTQCSATITWTAPTAADNCAPNTPTSSHTPGSSFGPGVTTVTYSVSDAAGNTGSCTFDVTISQTALSASVSALVYGGGANTSCAGAADGEATAMPAGGCMPYSYAWSNGATTQLAPGLAAGTYSVTVTDGSGNTQVGSVTIVDAQPLAGPFISFSAGGAVNCDGDSVVAEGAAGFNSYSWSNGNSGSTTAVTTSGMLYLTVVDSNGCSGLDSVMVTFNSPTVPVITQTGNVLTSTAGASYQWFRDGVLLPGETNQTITATIPGTYTVVVTDANGCSAESNGVSIVVAIDDAQFGQTLEVFPNPFTGSFTVDLTLAEALPVTATVYALNGSMIWQGTSNGSVLRFRETIESGNVSAGVYFLRIQAGDHLLVRKVVKQ